MARPTLEQRLENCQIPVIKKLLKIMIDKKTNLCVAADFKTFEEVLKFIEIAGKHIAMLKTHCEWYKGPDVSKHLSILYEKKRQHNFLLFEDRKFFDGGEVVKTAYQAHYAPYADLVTVVPLGDGMFRAIESSIKELNLPEDEPRGCLAVCELSFAGAPSDCCQKYFEIAERNAGVCAGIIAQTLNCSNRSMIKATPGIRIDKSSDGINQQWKHPRDALDNGADILIVGRGIISFPEGQWEEKLIEYKNLGFSAAN